jgi:hypothetical protein
MGVFRRAFEGVKGEAAAALESTLAREVEAAAANG